MTSAERHYYKKFRGEGQPAMAALWSARRHVHFVERLSASVKEDKRRSKAARKGWKTRRAKAAS